MTSEGSKVIPFPVPDPDYGEDGRFGPDPVEELKQVGRAFKERTGLNADEAAEFIMARVRHRPLSDALSAKVAGTRLDPEARGLSLAYKLTKADYGWQMEDLDGLDIIASGATKEGAVNVFLRDLSRKWDRWADEPDSLLSEEDRVVKRKLLGLFGLVAEEDKEV